MLQLLLLSSRHNTQLELLLTAGPSEVNCFSSSSFALILLVCTRVMLLISFSVYIWVSKRSFLVASRMPSSFLSSSSFRFLTSSTNSDILYAYCSTVLPVISRIYSARRTSTSLMPSDFYRTYTSAHSGTRFHTSCTSSNSAVASRKLARFPSEQLTSESYVESLFR